MVTMETLLMTMVAMVIVVVVVRIHHYSLPQANYLRPKQSKQL